jgi:hypothetical protein
MPGRPEAEALGYQSRPVSETSFSATSKARQLTALVQGALRTWADLAAGLQGFSRELVAGEEKQIPPLRYGTTSKGRIAGGERAESRLAHGNDGSNSAESTAKVVFTNEKTIGLLGADR